MEGNRNRKRIDITILPGSKFREMDIKNAWMFNKSPRYRPH